MSMSMPMATSTASPDMSGMGGMDGMGDTSGMSSMSMDMMTPWLHFIGGDNLFFKTLHPSSHGAIAGACIILGLLAIFERWIAGVRGVLESHWNRRTQRLVADRLSKSTGQVEKVPVASTPAKELDGVEVDMNSLREVPAGGFRVNRVSRLSPPFILSHDVPRGVAFAFQAFLAYILMLAVMTFQAAYIISIIVGLGIGEVMFGRLGSARGHILH